MRDRGGTAAVLEVDTEAQATGSLEWVEPTIAVYTNLGDDPTSMFSSKQVRLCLVSWVSMWRCGMTWQQCLSSTERAQELLYHGDRHPRCTVSMTSNTDTISSQSRLL